MIDAEGQHSDTGRHRCRWKTGAQCPLQSTLMKTLIPEHQALGKKCTDDKSDSRKDSPDIKKKDGKISFHVTTSIPTSANECKCFLPAEPGLLQSGDSYYDADTLYWLSRIISAEARGEPLVGQIAVGNVVFNRIADPEFPETVYGVIFDKNNGVQFTPTETGDIYESPKDISILAAKLCLEGADYSCGATYFISYKVIECWAMSNKDLLTVIGGHRFYGDK